MHDGDAGPGGHPGGNRQAASLLSALERLRGELGGVADELIRLLRAAGVTPGEAPEQEGRGPDGA